MPESPASSRFPDLVRIHFLGTGSEAMDHFLLKSSEWPQLEDAADPTSGSAHPAELFLIEVEDRDPSSAWLEEVVTRMTSEPYLAGSFLIGNLSSARRVAGMAEKLGMWTATVFGVDPDYFFGLVPLDVPGYKEIESFVQGLKPANTAKKRLSRLIKRLLILLGFSSPLYESFVVVLERPACS